MAIVCHLEALWYSNMFSGTSARGTTQSVSPLNIICEKRSMVSPRGSATETVTAMFPSLGTGWCLSSSLPNVQANRGVGTNSIEFLLLHCAELLFVVYSELGLPEPYANKCAPIEGQTTSIAVTSRECRTLI
eukprot:2478582-Amphidinium_carterae.1